MSFEKHVFVGSLRQSLIESVGEHRSSYNAARNAIRRERKRIVRQRETNERQELSLVVPLFIDEFCVRHGLDKSRLAERITQHQTPETFAKNELMYHLYERFRMSQRDIGKIFGKTKNAVGRCIICHKELLLHECSNED